MAYRFAFSLVLLALGFGLFSLNLTLGKNEDAGLSARFSYATISETPDHSSLIVAPIPPTSEASSNIQATPAAQPTATPVPPTATPPPPTPTPASSESGSRSGSSVFITFLIIIFGGIILAVVVSTRRVGRRRR